MYSGVHEFIFPETRYPEVYNRLDRVAIVPHKRPAGFPSTLPSGCHSKLNPSVYEPFVHTSRVSTQRSVWSFANLLIDILVLVA